MLRFLIFPVKDFIDKMYFGDFFNSLYLFIRPLIKWFLHRFTNLCELQVSMHAQHHRL